MKQIYASLLAMLLFFLFAFDGRAQCLCSGGSPATVLTYEDTVLPTQASTSVFTFPKFNPSTGTLSCISFNDTVSAVITTAARNTDTTVGHNYLFQTTISDAVNGPDDSGPTDWLVTFGVANQTYGPIWLDTDEIDKIPPQPRKADDSATFGPDTLINNLIGSGSTASVAAYLGTSGTVSFSNNLTGGAVALLGGTNYLTSIKSNSWGTFRLSYYWCPTILLSENMINFTAVREAAQVQLQWITENEQSGYTYEIELSNNESTYVPIGYRSSLTTDINQRYQYSYPLGTLAEGTLYFRIKRIAADGSATYTVIKAVNLNAAGVSADMHVFPNPVKNSLIFDFDEIQNGDFSVQLVNTAGQVIQRNAITVSGNSQIKLDLSTHPAVGLYFLYVKDLTHNQQYIAKVLVNN